MAVTRQDAWSEDDDLLLAEVTLRHIREGGTQLAAFEEVGFRLNRTAAACGFRWNSLVRKKYESAIQIAKAQRQQMKSRGKSRLQVNGQSVFNPPTRRQDYKDSYLTEFALDQETYSPSYEEPNQYNHRVEQEVTFDDVIQFLRSQKDSFKNSKQMNRLIEDKEKQVRELREENQGMKKELDSIKNEYKIMNEDYQALMKIMERARKLAFLAEEEQEQKVSFKMDKNGNLERVEK